MITNNFLKLAMRTVLSGGLDFYLANSTDTVIPSLGSRTLAFTTTEDTNSVMIKTTGVTYFDEGSDAAATVSCINGCKAGETTPYYSLPLQSTTTISKGLMLKVNPYKENSKGEHIRGIMVKFSIPEN